MDKSKVLRFWPTLYKQTKAWFPSNIAYATNATEHAAVKKQ